ncbi:MAG: MarR family transcriptional regulator [Candidatus Eiseniibacteriota bacterium]|jgi:DNA-binding MarR family transcriptional regulator
MDDDDAGRDHARQHAAPQQSAFLALRRAHDAVMGPVGALLREHGISEPQYNVLRILRGAGGAGLPCHAIAERMITRLPDITRLLDRLETAGHVRRTRSERDRRIIQITLEPCGRELLEQLDGPVAALHTAQFRGLTREEQRVLAELLERLRTTCPPAPTTGGGERSTATRRSR